MKEYTAEDIKTGLSACKVEDCYSCPLNELPMIDCEVKLLDLSLQLIKTYEQKIEENGKDEGKSKRRERRRRV